MQDQPAGLQLRIVEGPEAGRRVPLKVGQNLVGRGVDRAQVRLASHAVSRRHLAIIFEHGQVFARDLASRNGTSVNGSRLLGTQSLHVGDVLEVGDVLFVLEPLDPDDGAADGVLAGTSGAGSTGPTGGMTLVGPAASPPTTSLQAVSSEGDGGQRRGWAGLRAAFGLRGARDGQAGSPPGTSRHA